LVTIIAGMLLGLFVYALFSFLSPFEDRGLRDGREFTDRIEVPLPPSVASATLALEVGAGRCQISSGSPKLLEASTSSNAGRFILDQRTDGDIEHLGLRLASTHQPWRFWRARNSIDVKLSDVPVWRLELTCGAARVNADLSACKVEEVRIEGGASSLTLRLGAGAPETRVNVEVGVSTIQIEVPESAGCEIRMDGALTSKHFSGFTKEGSGLYRTENFDGAAQRVLISAKAGVSSFRVRRYGG
jgi:hypothetical protein